MQNKARENAQGVANFFTELASSITKNGSPFRGFELNRQQIDSVVTMLRRNARITQDRADEYGQE